MRLGRVTLVVAAYQFAVEVGTGLLGDLGLVGLGQGAELELGNLGVQCWSAR